MEVPDVNVRVLYDFEYTTKDGRQIKIKCGERLFLINKTNSDWWHVIRSSERRPFYVPATYVQEIKKSEGSGEKKENKVSTKVEENVEPPKAAIIDANEKQLRSPNENERRSEKRQKDQSEKHHIEHENENESENEKHHSLIHVRDEPVGFSMGYRNRSSSLEEKKMFSVKLSSIDRQRILSKGKFGPKPQFTAYPEVVEETEPKENPEDVDYVNLRKEGEGFVIDEDVNEPDNDRVQPATNPINNDLLDPPSIEKIELGKTIELIKPDVISDSGSGYSFVSGLSNNEVKKSESSTSLPVISNIPHSNSLEELALEIQLKTYSLRSNNSSTVDNENITELPLTDSISENKLPSVSDNSFESNVDSAIDCSESSKEEKSKIDIDLSNSPVPLQRKLHYVGSFKTKQERQKWAKQHFSPEIMSDVVDTLDESKTNDAAKEITCVKVDETNSTKVEENLQSSGYSDKCLVQEIESDTNNVVSIAINYNDISESSSKDSMNSFLESSRKTEEHLQQIHQNLGIAQEASAKMENLISLNTKHKRNHNYVGEEFAAFSANPVDGPDGSKDNKIVVKTTLLQPKTSPSLKDSTESIRGANSTNSERGSTDSLLDIDKNLNSRKISCGTTTSESFVQTDGEDLDEGNSESETDSVVLGLNRMKMSKSQDGSKKKISLMRNRRVESHKARYVQHSAPPSPTPLQVPNRIVMGDWNEYTTQDGRVYYYNTQTNEKSWKPPRHRNNSNEDKRDGSLTNVYSGSSSPLAEVDEKLIQSKLENLPLPAGWKTKLDEETGLTCYINLVTGAKWFSSSDHEGRVYFFEENSNESSWTLPETSFVTNINENVSMGAPITDKPPERNSNRVAKTRSMIFDDRREDVPAPQVIQRNWPQLWDGHMRVLKEGALNRTKVTENGKRLRKNWAPSYVVLTELFLLFFKDVKAFTAWKNGGGGPEMSVDLNGALINKGDKFSSRKNVFVISNVIGLQVLIQSDCLSQADQWLQSIQSAIKNLPSGIDSCIRITKSSKDQTKPDELLPEDPKKVSRIGRSKSVKLKKEGSIEDLSVNSAERQTKIKARLKKFFHRRPTMEALVKKGIWKDEPAFGSYLDQVCGKDQHPRVPVFVQRCIQTIESSEENMKTDGLYRASGNLSQVQKIRLQVDQNNYAILDQEEDVHVLTGALKLFFRELKQPLIPFHLFKKAIEASTLSSKKEKLNRFRDIAKNLPIPNHDTLKFLLQHLLRVTKYQEFNRMHIPNLAIVFGPTLMWPEQESQNMALDLMHQNLVIECFLVEFDHIFRGFKTKSKI